MLSHTGEELLYLVLRQDEHLLILGRQVGRQRSLWREPVVQIDGGIQAYNAGSCSGHLLSFMSEPAYYSSFFKHLAVVSSTASRLSAVVVVSFSLFEFLRTEF